MKIFKIKNRMFFLKGGRQSGRRPTSWTEKVYAKNVSEAQASVTKSNNRWNRSSGKRMGATVQVGRVITKKRRRNIMSFSMPRF